MNRRKLGKKVIVFFSLMVLLRFFLVSGIGYLNENLSTYIKPSNGKILISQPFDNSINTVKKSTFSENDIKKWNFKITEGSSFFVVINNILGDSTISAEDREIMQNSNPHKENFYPVKSYFGFRSEEYIKDETVITFKGQKASRVSMYLIKKEYYAQLMEIRAFLQSLLFTMMLIFTGISIFLRFQYKGKKNKSYFLLFSLMGIVSIIKILNSGELNFLISFLNYSGGYRVLIDNLTSILNSLWPFFIISCIFKVEIPKKYLYFGLSIVGIMVINEVFSFIGMRTVAIVLVFMMVVNNVLLFWGFVKEKEHSTFLLSISLIYSSLVLYYFQIIVGSRLPGVLEFFVNPAYIGAVIYMGGFIFVILSNHFKYIKIIEEERSEIDRIHLLRGINHDLKLPLSIIKLNNEMIEKYDLSRDESIDYARTTLDAALELESMMSNMSGYLSLKQDYRKGSADVGACFEKLDQYYSIYNQRDKFSFTCIKADKNCTVPVHSTYFSRMLYNLVDNSFKHNPKGVNVAARYYVGKSLKIEIEDDGIGIEKRVVDQVFLPFYRGDENRSISGMGLGMVVVKNVVDKLKGRINIKSQVGNGTKVTIVIPVKG